MKASRLLSQVHGQERERRELISNQKQHCAKQATLNRSASGGHAIPSVPNFHVYDCDDRCLFLGLFFFSLSSFSLSFLGGPSAPQYFKPNFLWFDLAVMGLMRGAGRTAQREPLDMVLWPT